MNAQIAYGFDNSQIASRFLNRLKSGDAGRVKARLCLGARAVLVTYSLVENDGFNSVCADLDDLAASMGGSEIPVP